MTRGELLQYLTKEAAKFREKPDFISEAPEKLYIDVSDNLSDSILYGFTEKRKEDDIEYTRTDSFIEKAERYIRSVADGLDRDDDVEAFISGFINYMKGEEV